MHFKVSEGQSSTETLNIIPTYLVVGMEDSAN